MRRRAFTLIELLIAIAIIGILAALALGALQRANGQAKIARTKSTIAKLNASLMDRWDGYRNRRLPIDPVAVLQNIKASGGAAYPYVQSQIAGMVARRGLPSDPLGVLTTSPQYPSNLQVAAVRLLAMRELMRCEMPGGFADFADTASGPTAGVGWQPTPLDVLPNLPGAAVSYLQRLNKAYVDGATPAALFANESAECLYMILNTGSTDGGLFGEQLPTDDVGDVDGDGLPEFQDAWAAASILYARQVTPNTPILFTRANSPIQFMRWAPGFVSPVQPDPQPVKLGDICETPANPAPHPATASDVLYFEQEFSRTNHDFFDPLKLDMPDPSGPFPRGFQLTPLVYSAGPDGLFELYSASGSNDPYDPHATATPPGQAGSWLDSNGDSREGFSDDVTNHDLDTRAGK